MILIRPRDASQALRDRIGNFSPCIGGKTIYRITMTSLLTGIALLSSSSVQGGSQNFESLPVGRLDMNNKITQNGIAIEFNQADKDRTGFAETISSPNQGDSISTKILHTNNLLTEFYFSGSPAVRDLSFELE